MHSVEYLGKCRRVIYLQADGVVQGIHSGGGAGNTLTGDALLVWMFNDPDAPTKFGCVEAYFNPVGGARPGKVDLTNVGDLQEKAVVFLQHRATHSHDHIHSYGSCVECTDTFDVLCDARDICITAKVEVLKVAFEEPES